MTTPTLAERLRALCEKFLPPQYRAQVREAAAEIERLTAALSAEQECQRGANEVARAAVADLVKVKGERDALRERAGRLETALRELLDASLTETTLKESAARRANAREHAREALAAEPTLSSVHAVPAKSPDEIARSCARVVRGCATDEQYCDLMNRIMDAIVAERRGARPLQDPRTPVSQDEKP